MDTHILLLFPQWLLFLSHVRLVLIVNEVNDGCPATGSARSIDGSEPKKFTCHGCSRSLRIQEYQSLSTNLLALSASMWGKAHLDVEPPLLQISLQHLNLGRLVELFSPSAMYELGSSPLSREAHLCL